MGMISANTIADGGFRHYEAQQVMEAAAGAAALSRTVRLRRAHACGAGGCCATGGTYRSVDRRVWKKV